MSFIHTSFSHTVNMMHFNYAITKKKLFTHTISDWYEIRCLHVFGQCHVERSGHCSNIFTDGFVFTFDVMIWQVYWAMNQQNTPI